MLPSLAHAQETEASAPAAIDIGADIGEKGERELEITATGLAGKLGQYVGVQKNFCKALDYSLSEIKGQHHSMFVDPDYVRSPEYKAFWAKLNRGEFDAREYNRIGKGGRDVWIQASYNPALNSKGTVLKVEEC